MDMDREVQSGMNLSYRVIIKLHKDQISIQEQAMKLIMKEHDCKKLYR